MYIYIDESGDFGWPITANSEPYMMFTLLVINDYRSKKTIAQAVSRAITDLKKRHPSCKNDPSISQPPLRIHRRKLILEETSPAVQAWRRHGQPE